MQQVLIDVAHTRGGYGHVRGRRAAEAGTLAAMSATASAQSVRPRTHRLAQHARFVRVIAGTQFKLKYSESALGYVWSLIKPLALFAVLYLVFGKFFELDKLFPEYPLYLLFGIVLWTFFSDAVGTTMGSVVGNGSLLRKLAFPRIVLPISATMTATMTFLINLLAIVAFVVWERVIPRADWVLILPLLLELYIFTLGISLILATLFVRFRDVGQIWELAAQLLFYATPIIYPVGFLWPWARSVSLLNPFTQVMQDIRALVLYDAPVGSIATASDVLGTAGHLYPIGIAFAVLAIGVWLFRREEPWFAERV